MTEELRRARRLIGLQQDPIAELRRLRESLAAVFPGSTPERLLRELTSQRPFLQEAQRAFEAIREAAPPWPNYPSTIASFTGVQEAMQRMRALESPLGVRLPKSEELAEVSSRLAEVVNLSSVLRPIVPGTMELAAIAAAMHKPWVDVANAGRSFESLARLQTLGKALRLPPFEPTMIAAARTFLGDWAGAKLSREIYRDLDSRLDFYRSRGFDERLTAIPEPAFTESLGAALILPRELLEQRSADVPSEGGTVEDEVQYALWQRMGRAYDLIIQLETQLRNFLERVMAQRFGESWARSRVPGEMLKHWTRKREEAVRNGESARPLVHYADFGDYVQVISRKDNWRDLFKSHFRNLQDLQVSFQRLRAIRVCVMHSRPIAKHDIIVVCVEVRRIRTAIRERKD